MVNLLQAWAEEYTHVQPQVMVQVAGGGSGVGIAGLIDGTLDVAAASREMRPAERQRATARYGTPPGEFTVARDALAVYVHVSNPLDAITFPQLADIYGEDASIRQWPQLGVTHPACRSREIIRVGRQNNSGTFVYFMDAVARRSMPTRYRFFTGFSLTWGAKARRTSFLRSIPHHGPPALRQLRGDDIQHRDYGDAATSRAGKRHEAEHVPRTAERGSRTSRTMSPIVETRRSFPADCERTAAVSARPAR